MGEEMAKGKFGISSCVFSPFAIVILVVVLGVLVG